MASWRGSDMVRLKDSKGKESTTLTFVTVAFLAVLIKYLLGGIYGPEISTGEFGAAVTLILGIWLNREWKEARYEKNTNANS